MVNKDAIKREYESIIKENEIEEAKDADMLEIRKLLKTEYSNLKDGACMVKLVSNILEKQCDLEKAKAYVKDSGNKYAIKREHESVIKEIEINSAK